MHWARVLIVVLILALLVFWCYKRCTTRTINLPPTIRSLFEDWDPDMKPPKLEDGVVVYISAPLFNLSETLYSIGIGGIIPTVEESLVDSLCNLTDAEMLEITSLSNTLGLPYYGAAGVIAEKGWNAYIPSRDGFVLAKYIGAVLDQTGPGKMLDPKTSSILLGYLTRAIYGNDVYALGAVCNVAIYNGDGLQQDDGSAAEVGMVGIRGLPTVYFRDQLTDQFSSGANNPMELGNTSTILSQRAWRIQDAVNLLAQKVDNILARKNSWLSGVDYASYIPPPVLVQFWLEMGSAVYLTRYKTKKIIVDPKTGIQDTKASCTDFFYQNYFVDGSSAGLTRIALKIMASMQAIEKKWGADFLSSLAGCKETMSLEDLQSNPTVCAPGS